MPFSNKAKVVQQITSLLFSIMDFILARNFAGRDHGTQMSGNSSENVAAVAAAAELRQMSSCQNPAYGRLSNFDIDRKVSEALIIRKHTAERGEHWTIFPNLICAQLPFPSAVRTEFHFLFTIFSFFFCAMKGHRMISWGYHQPAIARHFYKPTKDLLSITIISVVMIAAFEDRFF